MNAKTMLGLAVVFSGGYLHPPWLQMQIDRGTARKVRASGTENWPDALEDPDRRIAHPTVQRMAILDCADQATRPADAADRQDEGHDTGAPADASEGVLGPPGEPPDPADLSAEWGGCHG